MLYTTNLDTLALRQTDPRLLSTNDEDVALARSERIADGVFDVYNVETSVVTFPMGNHSNPPHITSTSDHGYNTSVKANELGDLSGFKIDLHRVVLLDDWVWETDPKWHKGNL